METLATVEGITLLIQGGALTLAGGAMFILYKVITNHTAHTNDVIEKNAESNTKLAVSLEKNSAAIDSLKESIDRK